MRLREAWDRAVNWAARALIAVFPSRARVIPHAEDPARALLTQFLVLHWGRLSLYLQHFESPESHEYFHRHRWGYMRSFVLSGYYVEERPAQWEPGIAQDMLQVSQGRTWRGASNFIARARGDTFTMSPEVIHRVSLWSPLCWTLFLTWAPQDDWGYYARETGAFTPWRDFVVQRVPSLETGEVSP